MSKQTFDRIKKTLTFLLAICFLMSVTAVTVSASIDPSWGPIAKQNYNEAYANGNQAGKGDGYNAGNIAGSNDCSTGLGNSGGITSSNVAPKSNAPADIGYADGYNQAYVLEYQQGYSNGFSACQANQQQGTLKNVPS